MIGIVDYSLGNVEAFSIAYKRLNVPVKRLVSHADFSEATHIILPGVGAFDTAMARLKSSGMVTSLKEACAAGKPVLGVCVGMQMLADSSQEGEAPGLGLIPGTVRRFEAGEHRNRPLRCPHMGWNDITRAKNTPLLDEIGEERFYFLHSYWFDPVEPRDVIATAFYGSTFCCAVQRENVIGVQFHPEKSHRSGLRLLDNFRKI